jgi:hypothetical protein
MNKVQKAFCYCLDLLNNVYETDWEISEAIADATIEFDLNAQETRQLRELQQGYELSFVSDGQ